VGASAAADLAVDLVVAERAGVGRGRRDASGLEGVEERGLDLSAFGVSRLTPIMAVEKPSVGRSSCNTSASTDSIGRRRAIAVLSQVDRSQVEQQLTSHRRPAIGRRSDRVVSRGRDRRSEFALRSKLRRNVVVVDILAESDVRPDEETHENPHRRPRPDGRQPAMGGHLHFAQGMYMTFTIK
jgi:hypothetical protein